MAQTGFTPTVTYNTATATTVPSAANLAQGELAVNVTDKKLYTKDSGGNVVLLASNGGDVKGPASSTNLAIPTFSGTGGKTLLNNSGATISAGVITATGFSGPLTGNASTVTTNANLTGPITSVGNATSIASQTGTGTTFAMSASPTFTGTVGAADLTTTGNTILGNASTDTLNVGNGGLVKDASGNVGIGTASPTARLTVSGNQSFTEKTAAYIGVDIATTAGNGGDLTVKAGNGSGAGNTSGNMYIGAGRGAISATSGFIAFGLAQPTNAVGLNAEYMRIHTTGGVSIGNTVDKGGASLNVSGLIYPQQATTAGAPAYVKGAIYFDTTLNKLRVGGATAWETITSV